MLGYGALLFAIAWWVDRKGDAPRLDRLAFPFALAVYCSSWTFFGGVGSAVSNGWTYLSIYLGPILLFLLAPGFLDRVVHMSRAARSTSIADFISCQYGRSIRISALVAGFALIASIPYVALQLRSVTSSFGVLVGMEANPAIGPMVALLLALFSISFGARGYETAGRNRGAVAAIAAESLIKIISFAGLGLFALWLFLGADLPARQAGQAALAARFEFKDLASLEMVTHTLLSALAILCLPRQFYIGFIQAGEDSAMRRARFPFILYLIVITLMVIPLALASLTFLPSSNPDLLVLELPLSQGSQALALLAFLGGFSAATGMVIAETIALSTMVTNDLLAPLLLRSRRAHSERDLGALMLAARRVIIVAILGAALIYSQMLESNWSLASIGLIAFAGVAQFAPALIASVLFGFADARAARTGMMGGLAVWAYTLFLPSIGTNRLPDLIARANAMVDPRALLGLDFGSALTHGTLTSLTVNIGLMLLVHYLPRRRRVAVEAGPTRFGHVATLGELKGLVARFVGEQESAESFDRLRIGPNPAGDPGAPIDGAAARLAEQLIASVIGAPSARLIVTSSMAGSSLDVSDVVRLLDESGHSLQFSRGLLSATLRAIDPGVSVVDHNLRLVAWNPRYREMFDYPDGYVVVGRPIADLIRYNAEKGECGPGEVDAHVERRLGHLRRGQPHSFERRRPSGRWIKTVGAPMPGGGYVMSFTDITAEKEAQAELEARVEARTRELAEINRKLDEAKTAAEHATRDKTRFLAAASHDLLQPLHAARLFCAALEQEARDGDQPLIRNIDRALVSADTLLRALLDVSKLDAGGVTPQPERFQLASLLDELLIEFLPLAAERGLALHAHPGDFTVETDRSLLRSILQNFLSNAVRYTAQGRIWIGARRRGNDVLIEVRDSGAGIPRADQERIFREFERLETKGSAGGGVGLGLAIVQRIARLLGHPLSVRSAPGKGSTFALSLPFVAPERRARPRPTGHADSGDPSGLVVLCVDNDETVLAALEAALRSRGCRPLLARSSARAVALAKASRPSVALIDLHLDEPVDGLDIGMALRAEDPGIALAIVTADRAVAEDPRIGLLGASILPKPVDPNQLWAYLTRIVADLRRRA